MSKINNIGETVQYSYNKTDIGMSVYVDDIAGARRIAKSEIRNRSKMEK